MVVGEKYEKLIVIEENSIEVVVIVVVVVVEILSEKIVVPMAT